MTVDLWWFDLGPLATRQRKLCYLFDSSINDEFKEAVLAVKAVDLSTTTPTNCNNRSTLLSID